VAGAKLRQGCARAAMRIEQAILYARYF